MTRGAAGARRDQPVRRSPWRRPRQGLGRLVRRYRRLVVALLLAVASGVAVDAATAVPPPGTPVTSAARDLPAGTTLQGADLVQVAVPRGAVPAGALPRDDLVGRVLAAPVRRGEAVTDVRLLGSVSGLGAGQVAVAVRLGDAGAVRWVQPGQRVDVLAVPADPLGGGVDVRRDQADVVARNVVVLDVPAPADSSAFGAGVVGGAAGADAPVVLLSVDGTEARSVAASSAGAWLTLTLLP